MTTADLGSMTVEQLIDYFVETAVAQEQAIIDSTTDTSDPGFEPAVQRMQQLYRELGRIDGELRTRGREARLALMPLYDHDNVQVMLEAAHYTLGVAPEAAREVIQWIADSDWPPSCVQARSIISALKSGNFKPD